HLKNQVSCWENIPIAPFKGEFGLYFFHDSFLPFFLFSSFFLFWKCAINLLALLAPTTFESSSKLAAAIRFVLLKCFKSSTTVFSPMPGIVSNAVFNACLLLLLL